MNWTDIVSLIKIENRPASWEHDYKIRGPQIKWKTTPLYPDCQLLDLEDNLGYNFSETPHSIQFVLNERQNTAFNIHVVEKERAPRKRHLKRNFLAYTGPKIESLDLMKPKAIRVILGITQFKYLEREKKQDCQNYPSEKFRTFQDCDEDFIKDKMKSFGLMPFWATDNMEEVTKQRFPIFSIASMNVLMYPSTYINYIFLRILSDKEPFPCLLNYVDGSVDSPCPPPCTNLKVCY